MNPKKGCDKIFIKTTGIEIQSQYQVGDSKLLIEVIAIKYLPSQKYT